RGTGASPGSRTRETSASSASAPRHGDRRRSARGAPVTPCPSLLTDRPPRVSIIMPVFDPGPDLAQALRSVAAQTFTDRALALVDDGSRDPATLALLESAAGQPGVFLHRTPNGGPSRWRSHTPVPPPRHDLLPR